MGEKATTFKRTMWIIAIVTFLIVEIIGLCFGKVIEENLFAEVMKWIVMGVLLAALMCGITWTLVSIWINRKNDGLTKK